jgi:hypothetical protein
VKALKTHSVWQERLGTELSPGEQVAGQLHAFLAAVDVAGDGGHDDGPPEPKAPATAAPPGTARP